MNEFKSKEGYNQGACDIMNKYLTYLEENKNSDNHTRSMEMIGIGIMEFDNESVYNLTKLLNGDETIIAYMSDSSSFIYAEITPKGTKLLANGGYQVLEVKRELSVAEKKQMILDKDERRRRRIDRLTFWSLIFGVIAIILTGMYWFYRWYLNTASLTEILNKILGGD
jgi:hypothetical protein